MKAEIRRIVGLLPLMLLSVALLSLLVGGSGVLAHRSFQSPISPLPTVPPSPTATAIPPTETPTPTATESPEPTETPTPMATEAPEPMETPTPTSTESPEPTKMPLSSPTPTLEAAPPVAVASPIPSAEETSSQPPYPGHSWGQYIGISLVALAYTWRALGVLAFIAFLGLAIFLALGRWKG